MKTDENPSTYGYIYIMDSIYFFLRALRTCFSITLPAASPPICTFTGGFGTRSLGRTPAVCGVHEQTSTLERHDELCVASPLEGSSVMGWWWCLKPHHAVFLEGRPTVHEGPERVLI